MELKVIDGDFTVCRVEDYSQVDWERDFCFIGKTDEEKSLVCPRDCVPSNVIERSDGWRAFRIQGVLDFSLIGILSRISTVLASNGIGIFAVSTYNTDYIFVKAEDLGKAMDALAGKGYVIMR